MADSSTLRHRRASEAPFAVPEGFTGWSTRQGGFFIDCVQRPAGNGPATLQITLARSDYKLLEVLHDDVATYLQNLCIKHVQGLRKSAAYNAQQKELRNAQK